MSTLFKFAVALALILVAGGLASLGARADPDAQAPSAAHPAAADAR